MAKRLHPDFFDYFGSIQSCNYDLEEILYDPFGMGNDLSYTLSRANPLLQKELKKIKKYYKKALPHLLKIDGIIDKVRKLKQTNGEEKEA